MPRTSTTRIGNGRGHGGQANGPGKPPGNRMAGRPEGVKTGEGKRSVADLLAAKGAREAIAERWMAIINDPAHPHHATMLDKGAQRMDGAAVQRLEVRDADPATMTDEELAAIASRGRRASADAEAAAD